MTITEFETDDVFAELNRKFANVTLEQPSFEDLYKEVHYEELFEFRDVLRFSLDNRERLYAIKNIRRYLTQEITEDRIQNVLDLDILDVMANYLNNSDLQYETAWAVTNLAFGSKEQTAYLIQHGIVDALIQCFTTTNNYRIKSQSSWGLANISIDSSIYRQDMAKLNVIGDVAISLIQKYYSLFKADETTITFQNKTDSSDIKDLTWSLANLCRGGFKTAEYWEQYLLAFNAFSQCIFIDDPNIWSESCWGLSRVLSNMFDNGPFYQNLILNPKLYPRLVSLISVEPSSNILPVLQTISNFTSAPNNYIEALLAADLLHNIHKYTLPEMHPQLRRNAYLTIANLAAGGEAIVSQVVYDKDIMSSVMSAITIPGREYTERTWILSSKLTKLRQREEWKILKEVLWVISNILALANEDCICYTLREYTTTVPSLASLLQFPKLPLTICFKLVDVFTSILERTTKIAELASLVQPIERNPYIEEMVREGVLANLGEQCIQHKSEELQRQAEVLYTTITQSTVIGQASVFGLPHHIPNVRRIVHGFQDGDIRMIESAFTNIQI